MAGQADNTPTSLPVTSSAPAELPEKQEALAREVLLTLERERIPYAVAGAFALLQHTGIARATKDLDLFLTAENWSAALTHLKRHGFQCEVCDPVWLAKVHRDNFFVDLITGMSNAAVSVEDSWIRNALPASVLGIQTRVLAPEELLVSKLFVTRRERFDGADVAHIIYGTAGDLDWGRILHLVGEHWEMLLWALVLFRYVYPAKTHYVPAVVWQDLLARYLKLVLQPDGQGRFRGSLIDDNMFAIDVKEWGLDDILEEYRSRRLSRMGVIQDRLCG
ncbi:MAG TPA: nucleotidyltransferase [Terriglobales bacterium]|nr:nucleotidyltransferase [Terriglobales bacterium]